MKLGVWVVLAAGVFAGSVVACGDDDYVPPEHGDDDDTIIVDASLPTDATVTPDPDAGVDVPDASTDAIEQCQSCIFDGCGPALVGCVLDEDCRTLITCVLQSNCLGDLPSCVGQCVSEVGETDVLADVLKLADIAKQCSECATTCEGAFGIDAGLGDFGDFGGFGGF